MRRSNSFIQRCAVAALGLALAVSVARGQQYKIKLDRPDKVGDEYVATVSSEFTDKTVITANGQSQTVNDQTFKAELHGAFKVLAVNDRASATKIRITVNTLTKDGADLYPAGAIITAEGIGRKTTFLVDNSPVDGDNVLVLQTLISVESPAHSESDDELNGTDQPQKVGDSWSINTSKIAREISGAGVAVDPQLNGQSTLLEVKKENGVEVMVVQTSVTADVKKKKLGNGLSITDGAVKIEQTTTLPTDSTGPVLRHAGKRRLEMSMDMPNGAGKVDVFHDEQRKEEFEPAKQ